VERNAEARRANLTSSITWLDQELERQRGRVEASERAMATYREQQNALSLQDSQNIVVARLNSLNDAVTKARTALAQKESLYDQVKGLSAGEAADTIPAIQQNNYIQSLKSHVADLERERANLAERYGERHPEIIKINASIRDSRRQLDAEVGKALEAIHNDYQTALAEEALARALARGPEGRGDDAEPQERQLHGPGARSAEQPAGLRVAAPAAEGAAGAGEQPAATTSAWWTRPKCRAAPFLPNMKRSLLMATLAGLALALALVGGLTYLDDTVKTPEDVAQKLQVPFLGMVPKCPAAPPSSPATSRTPSARRSARCAPRWPSATAPRAAASSW
jgi:uncharacterized protein involved in exopolysaccharide biosynthesis